MRRSSNSAGLVVWVLVMLFGASRVQGEEPSAADEFDQHYERGASLYEAGQYRQAAAELMAAYAIRQIPALLINIGQANRKAGYPQRALEMYEAYFRTEPNPPPEKKVEVDAYVAAAREAIEVQRRMRALPPQLHPRVVSRPPPVPRHRGLTAAAWTLGALGVAGLIAGGVLWGLDGWPTCSMCGRELDGRAPGAGFVGAGAGALGASVVMLIIDRSPSRTDVKPRW